MKNRIMKEKRVGIAITVVALAALILVTACAPSTPSVPTTKQVPIGVLYPLTGGGGPATQPAFQGIMDYVRYFNEAEGDHGFSVKVLWRDTMTQRPPFLSGWSAFVEQGIPLINVVSSQDLQSVWNRLEKDQTPVILGATASSLQIEPPGWVFDAWCPPGEQIVVLLEYFMENWKEERPPRLSFAAIDATYGLEAVADAAPYAESIGFEVLSTEVCAYVMVDATPQLLRIQESEADFVYMQLLTTGIGPMLKDAKRLGLIGELQFGSTTHGLAEQVLDLAGDATDGILCWTPLPWFDETEIPGVKTLVDKEVEYHGKVLEDTTIMQGWTYGAIICEAARLAIEQVGYENVDGPSMRRALESMDLDLDGMVRITYGPERRRGDRIYAVYEMQGGKRVRVSDWREAPLLSR